MTAALIELETGDFAYAARVLVGEVADPAAAAMRSTWSVLGDCAGMAGNDPGGAEWGSAYDGAATAAADATVAGEQAVEQVARMFGQTAGNYLAADAASMPYPRLRPVLALPPVPAFALATCRPPSAIGAAGGGPPGWGLIADAVGYVWPNGHQDRLRRAGAAWQRSSAVLAAAASSVLRAPQSAALHGLPEYADVLATCSGLAEHLREVSHVHARLAAACAELADHLDRVHGEVIGELRSLVEWTAGIEGASAVLSVFTLGAAEIPGQAAEAARVARTAAVVGRCIERFLTAASSLASDVASVVDRAGAVGARLRALVELPLLEPALAGVGPLRVLNEAREVQAVARLEEEASLPQLAITGAQLERKFKHAADFGVVADRGRAGFDAFEQALRDFIHAPQTIRRWGSYRGRRVLLSYERRSRLVVVQEPSGEFVTGWRMRDAQLNNVVERGALGGG